MGVVELDRDLRRELVPAPRPLPEAPEDVLQGGGDEEVLLLEPQLLAGVLVVRGIEDLGDVLGLVLVLHRPHVFAGVEAQEVELAARLRRPQPEGVHVVGAEAHDQGVVGHRVDVLGVDPAGEVPALRVTHVLGAAVELHREESVRTRDLPWVAVAKPVVGGLDLEAVPDALLEDPVFVADAVAVEGHPQGGRRLEKAGREAAKAPVAEARVPLLLLQLLEVVAQTFEGFAVGVLRPEAQDVVEESPAHEELEGEVVDPLGIGVVVGVLRPEPSFHQTVPHRVGEPLVGVEVSSGVLVLGDRVHHPVREGLGDAGNVQPPGDRFRDPLAGHDAGSYPLPRRRSGGAAPVTRA